MKRRLGIVIGSQNIFYLKGGIVRIKILERVALATAVFLVVALGLVPDQVHASIIQTADIVAIPSKTTGSGNGTLNLRMLTFSGSEITNTAGLFNGDNGNNTLPHAGGADTSSFVESYVTTAGELQAYYNLNFLSGSIHEIVLFLDLNETKSGEPNNTLAKLDVILNPTSIEGNPDPLGDVSSATQAAIDQIYLGGTIIANLNPQPAANLPVISEGAGFADYAIFTGIDPFGLNESDVLLFNVSMNLTSNSSEEIFLSGTYAPTDIPEPTTMVLLAMGGLALSQRHST